MKLIIQIPCFNEEQTLPITIKELPKKIDGIDEIEVLVINDGSTDNTAETARKLGVKHIISFPKRRGLACAFKMGIETAIQLGADIIVNTDGDNQYKSKDIPRLIEPILSKKAEIVIGCRDIFGIKHFSLLKKVLQRSGSYIVRKFSNTEIPDVTSGFRAYSKDAALRLNIFSTYTYTVETIIQAGRKEVPITYINIEVNENLRKSRLIKSTASYIMRSIATMLRIYLMYEPMKFFVKIGSVLLFFATLIGIRYLYFLFFGLKPGGHIQSLILSVILTIIGVQLIFTGLLADVIAANRKLEEEVLYRLRKNEAANKKESRNSA